MRAAIERRLLLLFLLFALFGVQHVRSFRFGYSYTNNRESYLKKKPLIAALIRKPATPIVLSQPPCCSDLIGTLACRRWKKNNLISFLTRCEQDPDFSILQCCASCGVQQVGQRHEAFFHDGENSRFCFDRHSTPFCQAFLLKRDPWGPSQWSCAEGNAHLAMRICRKTCGYCRSDLYADDRKPAPPLPTPPPFPSYWQKQKKCKQFV